MWRRMSLALVWTWATAVALVVHHQPPSQCKTALRRRPFSVTKATLDRDVAFDEDEDEFVYDPDDTRSWREKYLVEIPRKLDPKKTASWTKFDKYKASYMGQYNEVEDPDEYAEFASLVDSVDYNVKVGERITGRIAVIDGPQKAWVEIGGKTYALLPLKEASIAPPANGETMADIVNLGQEYEVEVISDRDDAYQSQTIVSLKRIQYEKAWDTLAEMYFKDPVVEGTVVAVNRGGAIVLVEGLRAFCPGSHLMASGGVATEDMVGKKLQVKFLEVNKESSKLVVSNKRATLEHAMDAVERGTVVRGRITAVKNYGAFVEVLNDDADGEFATGGQLSGLLHISQISYDRVSDIDATLHEGMELHCMILDYDKSNGRIALSTKTLEPEPGDMLRDPQRVYDLAHDTAAKYHARIEAERQAREKAAQEMVLGLGDDFLAADDSPSLSGDSSDLDLPDLATLD